MYWTPNLSSTSGGNASATFMGASTKGMDWKIEKFTTQETNKAEEEEEDNKFQNW